MTSLMILDSATCAQRLTASEVKTEESLLEIWPLTRVLNALRHQR